MPPKQAGIYRVTLTTTVRSNRRKDKLRSGVLAPTRPSGAYSQETIAGECPSNPRRQGYPPNNAPNKASEDTSSATITLGD